MSQPLADFLRPKSLDEVVGQQQILSETKPLFKMINSGKLSNLIFYGPPGTGKTTVAQIIANATNKRLHKINGTTATVSDIRSILEETNSLLGFNGILLYIDEIQYFNKKQQQTLLEFLENGRITLIASTTENPYFYIFPAILSRCTIFEFAPCSGTEIEKAVRRGISKLEEKNHSKIEISDTSVKLISMQTGGDVRKALNALEICYYGADVTENSVTISAKSVEEIVGKTAVFYDRNGDEHYNLISAFQKSIRGSDENAALYYLAKLVLAGDLVSICRRLLVISSEDIGLAFPQAISIVKSCVDSANQLGFPEARIPLAQATILLATSPKSNSAVYAINSAMEAIRSGGSGEIPKHLKDGHYKGAASLGNAKGYQYPHDFKNHYIKQQYLPDEIAGSEFYVFGKNKIESAAQQYWREIKK